MGPNDPFEDPEQAALDAPIAEQDVASTQDWRWAALGAAFAAGALAFGLFSAIMVVLGAGLGVAVGRAQLHLRSSPPDLRTVGRALTGATRKLR